MSKLSYKTLFTIFFFLLIGVIVLSKFVLPNQKVSAAWWNDMWQYRVAVNIGNTGSSLANFQVPISIGTSTLINSGKMQSDCDDIRVVDINGKLLNYWISGCGTTSTQIWPKVPSIPNGGATLYVYYGNSSATSYKTIVGTNEYPGLSCKSILDAGNSIGNGNYWIDPTNGDTSDKFQAYCDMTNDSGGWMLVTQSMINSEVGSSVTPTKTTNINDGVDFLIMNNHSGCGGSTYYRVLFNDIIPWTKIKADYEFLGGHSCWSIFGNTGYSAGTNLTPFVLNTDTIRNQIKMGGTNGDNYDGINSRCDNETFNFWHSNQGAGTTRSAQVILRRNSMASLAGIGTGVGCDVINYPWKYKNIYIREDIMTFSTTVASPATEEVGTGPIAYWKFDEGIGTTVYDSSSNGKNGYFASTAPAWADESQCISGKCLSFNGTQSAFSNYDVSWNNSNNISISFWVKPQNITDVNRGILGKKNTGYEWSFYQSNSAVSFVHWDNTGNHTNGMDDSWGNVLTANKWTHLVYSWNGSVSKFYANGKLVKTKTATNPSINMNQTNNMMFGGNIYTWGDSYFRGFIDEVKIYSYVRTADQVKLDYNSRGSSKGSSANLGVQSNTIPSLTSSLAAYWKFDEGIGTSVFDSSINKTNGYLAGATKPIWTIGKYNSGIAFSGVNDSVIIPYRPNFRDAFTVSIWMKRTTGYNQLTDVMLLSPPNAWYFYDSYNSGTIRGDVYIDGIRRAGITVPVPFDGNWYHIAYTYDSATHFAKMYKNGILYGRTELTGLANYLVDTATGNISNIGLNNSGRGMILDEPRIYNRALTAEEIKQDYDKKTATNFGTNTQTIGATTTNLDYCIPGDTSYCASPVAEWKMDEKIGTTVKDTSGNNNTGTFGVGNSAPTWTAGKIGAGLNFLQNQYINISTLSPTINDKYLTIEGWINFSSLSGVQRIFSNIGSNPMIGVTGSTLFIHTTTSAGTDVNTPITGLPTNCQLGWHHLTVTWDTSLASNNIKVYCDGINFTNGSLINSLNGTFNISSFFIGHNVSNQSLNGKIDHIKIYNYARTPAQIAYDYNRGEPVGWWKLDECQGNVAKDSSGIGNSGTIIIGASGTQNSLGTCQIGTSAAWTNGAVGKFNSSLNFDGTDDRVSCNDSTALQTNLNSNTIAFWFKSNTTNDCGFIRKAPSNLNGYFVAMNSSGKISARLADSTNTVTTPVSTKSYNDNNWHHVTTIINRNTQKLDIYIDGIYLTNTSSNISTLNNISNNSSLSIGSGYGAGAPYGNSCNAQIDDVRIYNYALTSEQIKILYNGGAVSFN